MISYAVPDEVLAPYLGGLVIDRWEGQAYVSVVGFHFGRTRVLGLNPGLIAPSLANFPQWNLRGYVKSGPNGPTSQRGIVFIKEFVPHPLTATIVHRLYNENYHAAPLTQAIQVTPDVRSIRYSLTWAGRPHVISVSSRGETRLPEPGSEDYFLTDRTWGWAANHAGTGFRVSHEPWRTYKVASYLITVDFARLYGPQWAFLNDRTPDHVTWCDGSSAEVSWRMRSG